MKTDFEKIFGYLDTSVPHPTDHNVAELPGLAIVTGKFDGFGSKICIPVEVGSEPFGPDDDDSGDDNSGDE